MDAAAKEELIPVEYIGKSIHYIVRFYIIYILLFILYSYTDYVNKVDNTNIIDMLIYQLSL